MTFGVDPESERRFLSAFEEHSRPIAHLFEDPRVTDIMLNAPSGEVWVHVAGEGMKDSGIRMDAAEAERLMRDISSRMQDETPFNERNPQVSCEFQHGLRKFRFEGLIPPASETPSFTVRIYIRQDARLSHYVESGELTQEKAQKLAAAAESGETLLIAGETGGGKTTLLTALLHAAGRDSRRRIVVIEDTPELDVPSGPSTRIKVNKNGFTYSQAIESALRQRPNSIVLGEIRDGSTAVQALRAWNTGHQGMGTIHAPSVTGMLLQIYNLCRESESGRHIVPDTVAAVINIGVHVKLVAGRRLFDVRRVVGFDGRKFELEEL